MRNAEQTRQLIVTQAMSLFNQKGYRATSLSDITKATGVTKGAIYGNFDNKDAVAVAAFEHAVSVVMDDLRKHIRAAPTAPLKLKAIAQYYQNYVANPPISGGCPVINTAIEADDNYPQLRTKVIRFIAIIKESLTKIVYRGIQEGQVKTDTDAEAFAIWFYACIKGAIIISRVEDDLYSFKQIYKKLEHEIDLISI